MNTVTEDPTATEVETPRTRTTHSEFERQVAKRALELVPGLKAPGGGRHAARLLAVAGKVPMGEYVDADLETLLAFAKEELPKEDPAYIALSARIKAVTKHADAEYPSTAGLWGRRTAALAAGVLALQAEAEAAKPPKTPRARKAAATAA